MKKILLAVYVTFCINVIFPIHAAAYIDPSVTTYLIQAVAGVVIAVGAVAGIYLRRAKKKVQDKLGIDENVRKEVEEDVVEFTDDTKK